MAKVPASTSLFTRNGGRHACRCSWASTGYYIRRQWLSTPSTRATTPDFAFAFESGILPPEDDTQADYFPALMVFWFGALSLYPELLRASSTYKEITLHSYF